MCVSTTGRWFDDNYCCARRFVCLLYMCVCARALVPASSRLTDLRSKYAWSILLLRILFWRNIIVGGKTYCEEEEEETAGSRERKRERERALLVDAIQWNNRERNADCLIDWIVRRRWWIWKRRGQGTESSESLDWSKKKKKKLWINQSIEEEALDRKRSWFQIVQSWRASN